MRVTIALETRFERTPDGAVWSRGWLEHSFWRRYLTVFDAITVAARVQDVARAASGAKRADGPSVHFHSLPYYVGPVQYVMKRARLQQALRACALEAEAVILRAPGVISTLMERGLGPGRPFGVEVVGDPLEVFGTGGVRSFVTPIMRHRTPRELRRQCQRACAVAYVSLGLRERYPASRDAFQICYSSIDLGDDAFAAGPRSPEGIRSDAAGPWRLILVGSLEQNYKGADILIDAVPEVVARGANIDVTIVGDGRQREELDRRARRKGVDGRVRFAGQVSPGAGVREELDRADLFVLPSRTEGLPRAMLEAMARGLPCLGTVVGGIPELLAAQDLVPPGDPHALALKIVETLHDRARMATMSERNLAKAREYHAGVLSARRQEFYQYVLNATMARQRRN